VLVIRSLLRTPVAACGSAGSGGSLVNHCSFPDDDRGGEGIITTRRRRTAQYLVAR
jgi:hypothetical protein